MTKKRKTVKAKTVKAKNPQDTTMRNARAASARSRALRRDVVSGLANHRGLIESLSARMARLEKRMDAIEDVVANRKA